MRTTRRLGPALAALAIAAAALAFPRVAAAQRHIVREGEPRAAIVTAEEPERLVRLAAQELRDHVLKMTGASLPIATAPSPEHPVTIYVGRSRHTGRLGVSADDLGDGAFRMASGDGWLLLLGKDRDFEPTEPWARSHADQARVQAELDALTPEKWGRIHMGFRYRDYDSTLGVWEQDESGSLQAVYAFLRDLGVRWYFPGDVGTVAPRRESIELPEVDKTVRPDFPFRNLHIMYQHVKPDRRLWRLRLGLNSASFGGSHGINPLHRREETREAHPDRLAIWGGERTSDKPCLSSESLFQANVAYARFLFDHYDVPMVNISPADGYSRLCECPLCEGKGTPERGPNGVLSDYVWGYVDRVARELRKSHPDRMVSGLAYTTYLLPPERIERMSPNVAVVFVRWRSTFTDPETKRRELDIRRQWLEKLPSQETYIWSEYAHSRPRGWYSRLPVYYPRLIAEDLRWLKGKSKGEYIPVADNWPAWNLEWEALATNHLNAYVTARLYWDAEQDLDALLDEYYEKFYGPAAAEMKAFIEFAEGVWWKVGTGEIDLREIETLLDLLGRARDRAGEEGVHKQRVDMVWEYSEPRLRPLFLEKGGVLGASRITVYPRDVRHGQPWMVDIDGRLDEASWAGEPRHRLVDAETGAETELETYFHLGSDGEYLYLGVRCAEPDMASLALSATGANDMNVWRDDAVSLVLVSPGEFHCHFAFNPAGAWVDQDRSQPGLQGVLWDSRLESAAHRGEGFWSVEARIPLASLSDRLPDAENPWQFNVGRERPRPGDRRVAALAPLGSRNFHHLDSTMAELVFE